MSVERRIVTGPVARASALVAALAAAAFAAAGDGPPAGPAPAAPGAELAATAARNLIDQCKELPQDHPYGCAKLAALEPLRQCREIPDEHQYGCRRSAAMDIIRQCNELPPDHPYGCRRLLSLVPKCPPGTVPGVNCRHMLVREERPRLRDERGQPAVRLAELSAVRELPALLGAAAPPTP